MTITYQKADNTLLEYLDIAVENYHPHLTSADVQFSVLTAHSSSHAPPIQEKGVPALAKIKVTNLKERALGLGDALIIVDGDRLQHMPDERIVAVFDHELSHLDLQEGEFDDLDRPKIKTVPHDLIIEGFEDVARRHGLHSVEVHQALNTVRDRSRQQALLPGFELTNPSQEDELDEEADAVYDATPQPAA